MGRRIILKNSRVYQVSFVVDDVEHDDNDGDRDEVRHEMTRRLHLTAAGQPRGRRQRRPVVCWWLLYLNIATSTVIPCTSH